MTFKTFLHVFLSLVKSRSKNTQGSSAFAESRCKSVFFMGSYCRSDFYAHSKIKIESILVPFYLSVLWEPLLFTEVVILLQIRDNWCKSTKSAHVDAFQILIQNWMKTQIQIQIKDKCDKLKITASPQNPLRRWVHMLVYFQIFDWNLYTSKY